MTLGYKAADGSFVALHRIDSESFNFNGAPGLRLDGRRHAAMSTGRVLRAAQSHFEFPVSTGDGDSRAGARAVAPAELDAVLERKRFAVFEDEQSRLLRLVYREIVVRFRADAKRAHEAEVLARLGLSKRRSNAYSKRQFIVYDKDRRGSSEDLVELALRLSEEAAVEFAAPNFVSQYLRAASAAPGTPAAAQWHLKLVDARKAWALTAGKRSVTVAVLDDGVDIDHPELKPNLRRRPDPAEPRDLCGRDFFVPDTAADHFNPRPKRFRQPFGQMAGNDIHGTACAGVAVGRGPRAFGLAPRCRLLPVKIFHADDLAADSQVADAIRYAGACADVLSCSWGGPRSPDVELALRDVAAQGRGGLGAVVVCAAGNDERASVSFPAKDPNCIAVAASTDADGHAFYSNRGPELCVAAPSNGGTKGIFTTDVALPGRGFNTGAVALGGADGLFTNDFGGTSSSTPLVAGLVALMLSVNPRLKPADVRRLLESTAVKIGPASGYDANGHSLKFGYGRIDARAAVQAARNGP